MQIVKDKMCVCVCVDVYIVSVIRELESVRSVNLFRCIRAYFLYQWQASFWNMVLANWVFWNDADERGKERISDDMGIHRRGREHVYCLKNRALSYMLVV